MATTGQDAIFPAERLHAFIGGALAALGLPEPDAQTCARRMTEADLRGPGDSTCGRACARCARRR